MLKPIKTLNLLTLFGIILVFSIAMGQPQETLKETARLQVLIPLYVYPNYYNPKTYVWLAVAAAQSQVPITAIINPNNGPGEGQPNRDYVKGLNDLQAAGVKLLGYISTNYGKRNSADIKTEVDVYSKYYHLNGIFLDEAASSAEKLNFYQDLYTYIKRKPNLNQVVLNQGTQTDEEYLSRPVADTVVIFENYSAEWSGYALQSYVSKYLSDRFAALIHSAPNATTMRRAIDQAMARNVKYVYITDDSPDHSDRNPWNSLPSYWTEEIQYIQHINQLSRG